MDYIEKGSAGTRIRIPFLMESVALAIIPFEEVLTLSIGSVLRLVNFFTIFCCLIDAKSIKFRRGKNLPLLPMFLFLFYAFISFFWCYNQTYFFDRLSTYGLYGILIILLCSLDPSSKEKLSMLNGLCVGGILAAFMIIVSGAAVDIGGRETLIIFGRTIDPNILSYSCVISTAVCMYRALVDKKQIVINIAFSVLLFSAIIICGSRGALVTCLAMLAIITLNIEVRNNKFIKKLLVFVLLFGVLIFVYLEFVLTSEFGSRFTLDNLFGQGNLSMANRDKIWGAAITQIVKRPVFGYGNGASMYAIEAVYRFYGTHNSYLLVLLEFGIVGFAIVLTWQLKEYRLICKRNCKIYKILYIGMLIFIMFVEGFSTKVFWGLQIVFMTACYGDNVESSISTVGLRKESDEKK